MSKDVVKVEPELIPSSRIESALLGSSNNSSALVLDPETPMPVNFNETWNGNESLVRDACLAEVSRIQSEQLTEKKKAKPVVTFLSSGKGLLTSLTIGMPVLFGLSSSVHLFPGAQLPFGVFTCAVSSLIMCPSFAFYMSKSMIREEQQELLAANLKRVSDQVQELSARSYQDILSLWALQRYGVTMTARWDSQVNRLADDIIFVGEKDGRKVYCQERPEGWVLTYNDGSELPVLVELKALTSV